MDVRNITTWMVIHGPQGSIGQVWIRVPHGEWLALYRVVEQEGSSVPVIAEMRVVPIKESEEILAAALYRGIHDGPVELKVPKGGLSTRDVRTLRLGATAPVMGPVAAILRSFNPALPRLPMFPSSRKPAGRSPGKEPLAAKKLARIARTYERAAERGARPVAEVARVHRLSNSTAKGRIEVARRRGFLTQPGRQGRTGGAMTDEARRVLGLPAHSLASAEILTQRASRKK